ncbi:Electron transfer DM13 [Popillia japonica]|uniref:Electron transfer DM13 n=1 Tax=Popillia japonica TaxID=7064 RepID=A0AAW1MDR5_POPJA
MLNQYENIQEQIEELADIECEDSEREEFERKYFHSVGLIDKLISDHSPSSIEIKQNDSLHSSESREPSMRLPRKGLNKDVDLKMQNVDCNEIAYQIPKGLIIEERRGILGLPNINETPNNLFTRYSSLSKLIRITAYCLRFSKNIISRIEGSTKENRSGNLTLDEVNEARRCLIKLVQREGSTKENRSGNLTLDEITLPPFRQLAHDLQSGPIEIISTTEISITKFYYDGKGPDAHFWVGKGVPSPNGTIVPHKGSTAPLPTYTGQNITIHLPNTLTINDIDYLAVWCVKYNHNFGHVFMNERYIKKNNSAMYLPLIVEPFISSDVKSDDIIVDALSEKVRIMISNIHYNQTGNNVHFRVGSGNPCSNDSIIPNEKGSFQSIDSYNGENIVLQVPENISLSEVDYLAVCNDDEQKNLSTVYFNRKLTEKLDIDITGFQLTKFSNSTYHLYSGPVLIINDRTFYIPNLNHNYNLTQFRVSFPNGTTVQVPDETDTYSYLKSYNGKSIYIRLPANVSVKAIDKFGVWHATKGFLSYVDIYPNATIPDYKPYPDVTNDGRRIIRVQKCCPVDQVVTVNGCQDILADFDVGMNVHLANDTHLNDEPMAREWIVFAPYINNINCPKFYLTPETDNYSLLTTDKLLYISAKQQLSLDKYCLDSTEHDNQYINTAFVCAEGDSGPQTMHIVFAICAFLSAVSLFLITGIYFLIRKEDDKRGFSIAGYAASMGVAFICLAVTQIAGLEKVCSILGGTFHFFIVMSFVWFVVIAYEAFYHVMFFDDDSVLMGYIRRRNIYFGLSWGIPMFFVVLAYVLDLPAGLLNTHLDAICLFNKQKWMLYVPIIICISLAVGLASYSTYKLGQNNSIPKSDTTRRFIWNQIRRDVQGRLTFIHFLVSLTALCWISEIITFALGISIDILDVIHALQGVVVLVTVLTTGGIIKNIQKVCCTSTPTQNGTNDIELAKLNGTN